MKSLKIAFITPEAVPYAKTGGLADISGVLPGLLSKSGHSVKLFLPMYRQVVKEYRNLKYVAKNLKIPIADKIYGADIFILKDKSTGLEIYFIGNKEFFDRPELYRDNKTGKDYKDNLNRFLFFSEAVLMAFKKLDWAPDIVHANDWQTALVPSLLKTKYKEDTFFGKTALIFTIHNLAYQGQFPGKQFKIIGLDPGYFAPEAYFEFWGRVNLMKAAICLADIVTTVSPTYAKEIQKSNEYGMGLEGVLKNRSKDLYGILNGVDYETWSPAGDKLITVQYTAKNLSGKRKNKQALLKLAGLPYKGKRPLIGMISRLDSQKGFDILKEIMKKVLKLDLQFILLGTGDKEYHDYFTKLAKQFSECFKPFLEYDNKLAHQIEAGADMFLMPSRYEPCGLNQMYSLKYGTVPIVRKTGGLADTIIDFDENALTGTGFVFKEYSSAQLFKTIKRACQVYEKKRIWNKLVRQGMSIDFSWESSARKYLELYRKALNKL
ncbi:MAG: glycogen synthase GlgA [Candidatus Zixiibacteriota bacterium]|nr:MAG: glycogen synthase GlgA [candidate division Zixibacteria bacterium]